MGGTMIRCLLLFALLYFTIPQEVGAQSFRVLVGGIELPAEDASKIELLENELPSGFSTQAKFRTLPPQRISKWKQKLSGTGESEAPNMQALDEARQLLQEGKRAYQYLKFDEAFDRLEKARVLFIRHLNLLRSNKDLLQTHLFLGMSALALKNNERSEREFERIASLDPSLELKTKSFSPEVITAYKAAQRKVLEKPSVRLDIESQPKKGKVFINGRLAGETPLRLTVKPGDHFILVEKSGYRDWYQLQKVGKRVQRVVAGLKPHLDHQSWGNLFRVREGKAQDGNEKAALFQMANEEGADLVFLSSLVNDQQTYRLLGQFLDVKNGTLSSVVVANVASDLNDFPGALDEVVAGLASQHLNQSSAALTRPNIPVGEAPPQVSPTKNKGEVKPLYKKWWIYPVLGGIAYGIYAASDAGGSANPTIVIDNASP